MKIADFIESVWSGIGTSVVVAATTGIDVWATLAGAAIALVIEVLRQRRRADIGQVRATILAELDRRCARNHPDQYQLGRTDRSVKQDGPSRSR